MNFSNGLKRAVFSAMGLLVFSLSCLPSVCASDEIRMLYALSDPAPRLVLADESGTEVQSVAGHSLEKKWSPNGDRVLLQLESDDAYGMGVLMLMHLDLSFSEVRGQFSVPVFYRPVWMPDGKHILIVDDSGRLISLEIEEAKSSVVCPSTEELEISAAYPSPNGGQFALNAYPKPYQAGKREDVFKMNADCSNITRLTAGGEGASVIRWAADGKRLAFVTEPEDIFSNKIVVIGADGSGRREYKEGYHYSVSWTDDGRLLSAWVDVSVSNDRESFLGIIDPSSGQVTVLKKGSRLGLTDADWRIVRKE